MTISPILLLLPLMCVILGLFFMLKSRKKGKNTHAVRDVESGQTPKRQRTVEKNAYLFYACRHKDCHVAPKDEKSNAVFTNIYLLKLHETKNHDSCLDRACVHCKAMWGPDTSRMPRTRELRQNFDPSAYALHESMLQRNTKTKQNAKTQLNASGSVAESRRRRISSPATRTSFSYESMSFPTISSSKSTPRGTFSNSSSFPFVQRKIKKVIFSFFTRQ